MKSILIGRKHGEEKWSLIAGPEVPHSKQVEIRQEMFGDHPINKEFAEVEFLRADARIRGRLQFMTADEAKKQKAERVQAEKDVETARKAAEDRQKKQADESAKAAQKKHSDEVEANNKKLEKALAPPGTQPKV